MDMIKMYYSNNELVFRFVFLYVLKRKILELRSTLQFFFLTVGLDIKVKYIVKEKLDILKLSYVEELVYLYRNKITNTQCRSCNACIEEDKQFCWFCGHNTKTLPRTLYFYKYGNRLISFEKMNKIKDESIGDKAVDTLQPSRHWDKSNKTWYTNPDFVKHYGDPFKDHKD